jgi:hypothetical protein
MDKKAIATALHGSQIGAVVACALGVDMPGPRFTSKAVVSSDGYITANFVGSDGRSHHSAFVGSFGELEQNMISVIAFLKKAIGLSTEDALKLRGAVLADWIAIDYR